MKHLNRAGFPLLLLTLSAVLTGCSSWGGKMSNTEGVRYYSNGQYDQALSSFQTASRLNPDDPEIYYNLASTYQQQAAQTNQPALLTQAENYYRKCLEKNPNAETTVCCYRGLATVLNQKNQKEEAMALLRSWEEKNPTSIEPKLEIAYLLEAQGANQDAAAALEKIAAYAPNDYRAFYKLGLIEEKLGQNTAALEQLRIASRLNPNDTEISQRIALLESRAALANTAVAAGENKPASTTASATAPAAPNVPNTESNWTSNTQQSKSNDFNVAAAPAASTAPTLSSNPFDTPQTTTTQIPQTQAVGGTPAYGTPAAGASSAAPIGSVPSETDAILQDTPSTYNQAPTLPDGTGANPFNIVPPGGSASVAPPVMLETGSTAAASSVPLTASNYGAPNASATGKQRVSDPVSGPPSTSVGMPF